MMCCKVSLQAVLDSVTDTLRRAKRLPTQKKSIDSDASRTISPVFDFTNS